MTSFGQNILGFGAAEGAKGPFDLLYVVVAGGGGGGGGRRAGGGGAGGYGEITSAESITPSAATTYTVQNVMPDNTGFTQLVCTD